MADPTLSKRDLRNPGDGLITFDSATSLEWLDLSETRNRSYDWVSNELNPGRSLAGWSYATFDQVNYFYKKFGFVGGLSVYAESDSAFVASWNDLVSFISDISNGVVDASFYGLLNDPAVLGSYVGFVKNSRSNQGGRISYENHDLFYKNSSSPSLASFLVRLAAPSPSAPPAPNAPSGLHIGD